MHELPEVALPARYRPAVLATLLVTALCPACPVTESDSMSDELVLSLDFESIEGDPPRFADGSGRGNHAVGMVYSTAEPIGITRDGGGRVGEGLNVDPSNWAAVPSDGLNLTRSVNVACWFKPAAGLGPRVGRTGERQRQHQPPGDESARAGALFRAVEIAGHGHREHFNLGIGQCEAGFRSVAAFRDRKVRVLGVGNSDRSNPKCEPG